MGREVGMGMRRSRVHRVVGAVSTAGLHGHPAQPLLVDSVHSLIRTRVDAFFFATGWLLDLKHTGSGSQT